jgi:hypothetical protein
MLFEIYRVVLVELEGQRGAWSTWTKRYDCHSVFQVDIGLDDILSAQFVL